MRRLYGRARDRTAADELFETGPVSDVQARVENGIGGSGGKLRGADLLERWAQFGDLLIRSSAKDLSL